LFAINFTFWSHILSTLGNALNAYLSQSRLCVFLNNTIEVIKRGSIYKVRASVVHVNRLGLTLKAQEHGVREISTHLRRKGVLILGTSCASGIITQHQALAEFFSFFPNDTPDFPYPTMYHMENMKNKPAFENGKSCQSKVNWLVIVHLKTQRNFVIRADLSQLWGPKMNYRGALGAPSAL
jgi:hypothetical protein